MYFLWSGDNRSLFGLSQALHSLASGLELVLVGVGEFVEFGVNLASGFLEGWLGFKFKMTTTILLR